MDSLGAPADEKEEARQLQRALEASRLQPTTADAEAAALAAAIAASRAAPPPAVPAAGADPRATPAAPARHDAADGTADAPAVAAAARGRAEHPPAAVAPAAAPAPARVILGGGHCEGAGGGSGEGEPTEEELLKKAMAESAKVKAAEDEAEQEFMRQLAEAQRVSVEEAARHAAERAAAEERALADLQRALSADDDQLERSLRELADGARERQRRFLRDFHADAASDPVARLAVGGAGGGSVGIRFGGGGDRVAPGAAPGHGAAHDAEMPDADDDAPSVLEIARNRSVGKRGYTEEDDGDDDGSAGAAAPDGKVQEVVPLLVAPLKHVVGKAQGNLAKIVEAAGVDTIKVKRGDRGISYIHISGNVENVDVALAVIVDLAGQVAEFLARDCKEPFPSVQHAINKHTRHDSGSEGGRGRGRGRHDARVGRGGGAAGRGGGRASADAAGAAAYVDPAGDDEIDEMSPEGPGGGFPAAVPSRHFVRGPPFPPGTTHVFIDYSNIMWSAKQVGDRSNLVTDYRIKLKDSHLAFLVEGGRPLGRRIIGGSKPGARSPIWDTWQALGYSVNLGYARGGEVFVDDMIVGQMSALVVDELRPRGQTIVLLTGDGNDNYGRASFLSVTAGALRRGWHVEVWAWKHSCSSAYRRLLRQADRLPGKLKLIYLDDYRDEVTYRDRSARSPAAKPVDSRPHAQHRAAKRTRQEHAGRRAGR